MQKFVYPRFIRFEESEFVSLGYIIESVTSDFIEGRLKVDGGYKVLALAKKPPEILDFKRL